MNASSEPNRASATTLIEASGNPLTSEEQAARILAAIVQSSDDAIASKDLNGIVTSWNPAAERMFGYTADEIVGRSIRTIIPADRMHEEDEVLRRVREGIPIDHFETVRRRKDGSLVDISLTVSPVFGPDGKIIGASKIARDISARKAAEETVRRTNEIKDQFLTLVSHELRTPISIIVGNGHLLARLRDRLDAADVEQALNDITSEAERLQRIIENLLLLTRVEGGDRIEIEFVQVERLVEQAIETLERRSPGRHVQFAACRQPPCMGEAGLVTTVLENLLSNADKYSPLDCAIEVDLVPGEDELEVHVLDRGIGLDSTDLQGLFSPFYRARQAKDRASGMGLGLAVCKRAVQEMGGTISARPRPGGGADFWFTLPFVDVGQAVE